MGKADSNTRPPRTAYGQPADDLCFVAFGSPLGGNHPVQFLDPRLRGYQHDIHIGQLPRNFRETDLSVAATTLIVRVHRRHGRDRHIGVSGGIFCVVSCAGAPQILVAVPDYNPFLDQLPDPRFPLESHFGLQRRGQHRADQHRAD